MLKEDVLVTGRNIRILTRTYKDREMEYIVQERGFIFWWTWRDLMVKTLTELKDK